MRCSAFLRVFGLWAALLLADPGSVLAQTREFVQLKGDVYRFIDNNHASIFVITGQGVVMTDPISLPAAQWLRHEVGQLTDQPITHLIFSHSHADHASGGSAFGRGLTVIAQQNAPASIDGVAPTVRFDSTYQFALGSKTFELTALGPGHGEDLLALIVRPENVLFVVDAVAAKRLPYRDFPGLDIAQLQQQIKRVQALNFELMAPGHGNTGGPEDVDGQALYVERLAERVSEAIARGLNGDALVQAVPMTEYVHWSRYRDWHALNIKGMARWLMLKPRKTNP